MSEYMKDSGHHDMRTCDDCGGAFYAARGPIDGVEEEWTCDTCERKDDVIKALADALEQQCARLQCSVCGGVGQHEEVNGTWFCEKGPTSAHPDVDAALRLAGRLP